MADSYRLSIFDQTGPDDIPKKVEESLSGKAKNGTAANKFDNSSAQSQSFTKDPNSSTIKLNSNTGSLSKNLYSESFNIANNDNIFKEQNVNVYKLKNVENEINISGPEGSPYEKIANIIADSFEESQSSMGTYSSVKDVMQDESDGAAALLYGAISSVVRGLENGNNNKSSGGNSNSSNGNYIVHDYAKEIKDLVIGSNTNKKFSLYFGTNYYSTDSLVGEEINELSNEIDVMNSTDYSDTNNLYINSISNSVDYDGDPNLQIKFENGPMSEMEAISYPDAMSNMYDVYFRIRDDNGHDSKLLGKGQAFIKALFSSTLLSARITSINIPEFQRSSSTISYASGIVERPLDAIETPGRSSFTIRGDTKLAYISAFNELAGTDMSNLFGKGSIITKGLENSSLVKIQDDYELTINEINKKQKELDEQYAKDWAAALEEDSRTIINNFTEGKKIDGDDKYEKYIKEQKDKYLKEHNDLSGFYTQLRNQMEHETEHFIEDSKNKKKTEKSDAAKAEGFFAQLKESRDAKRKIQKEVDEHKEDLKSLDISNHWEKRKAIAQAYTKQCNNLDTEVMEANNKRKQDIKNLHFEKEGFNYVTETLSKNVSVISKPATQDDLFNILKTTKRLDIIVKRTTPSFKFRTKLSDKIDERFIFEDVKILGSSDVIKFERENAGPVDFTYDFIYKRFYKLDTYDETGIWVTSQMSMLIDAAIDYALGKQTSMKRQEKWAKDLGRSYVNGVKLSADGVSNAIKTMNKSFAAL